MKFELNEYNVAPTKEEKDVFSIKLIYGKIIYNNKNLEKNKAETISNLLTKYKDEIVRLNSEKIDIYKGGCQRKLAIQYEDSNILYVIGNTSSFEMSNLYYKLKCEIINILELKE